MSENTNQPATNAQGQAQQQYIAEELNIGVWWTMKSLKEKSSLSVNMIDKGLKFRFTNVDEAGEKRTIERMLPKTSVYLFKTLFKAILADRLALAKQAYDAGTSPNYSAIPETSCAISTMYFSKDKNDFEDSGRLTLGTQNIEGKERVVITGYDKNGNSIRVVFHEETAGKLLQQASVATVIDTEDLGFYLFCLEVEQSLFKTVEYSAFNKIMHLLRSRLGVKPNTQFPQKSGGFGSFFKKKEERVQIGEENAPSSGEFEADSDLFDTSDSEVF